MNSYSTIFSHTHRAITDSELFANPVNIEEKIDGSQFSFQRTSEGVKFRSKGAQIDPDAPPSLFKPCVEGVLRIADSLPMDYVFRGESISSKKHNILTYQSVPPLGVVIFDIERAPLSFLSYTEKEELCRELGFMVAPLLYSGSITSCPCLETIISSTPSILGGKIEGVVIKPSAYNLFGVDKKLLMAKYVSTQFKETHKTEWKTPVQKPELVQQLVEKYKTQARWRKAIQHLKEKDVLLNSPKDIGGLLKELTEDLERECEEEIKEFLWKSVRGRFLKGIQNGFPEFYKELLRETNTSDPGSN